jgi:hypothetical protein
MARKTIFVSDFSGKEIADEKQSATITVKFGDGRRGGRGSRRSHRRCDRSTDREGRQQARRDRPKTTGYKHLFLGQSGDAPNRPAVKRAEPLVRLLATLSQRRRRTDMSPLLRL